MTKPVKRSLGKGRRSVDVAKVSRAYQNGYDAALEDVRMLIAGYGASMALAAEKPHPITKRPNLVAACKLDAAESIKKLIQSLDRKAKP